MRNRAKESGASVRNRAAPMCASVRNRARTAISTGLVPSAVTRIIGPRRGSQVCSSKETAKNGMGHIRGAPHAVPQVWRTALVLGGPLR